MQHNIIYKNILASMDNGVLTIDFQGKISTFNRAAEEMMGLKKEDVIGSYMNDVFFGSAVNESFSDVLIDLVMGEQKKINREIEFIKPDGKKIPLGINTSILENEEQEEVGVIVVLTDMSILKKSRLLQDTFSRYVTKQVVEKILENPDENIGLKGEKRTLTIMFTDIRGFTSLSEKLQPSIIVDLLNKYFSRMIDIVFENKGTLDKFIGDGLMCIFGAPFELENHEEMAIRTAIKMRQTMEEFNKVSEYPLSIGIGINTGPVVVGNIGSHKRLEYTVIGDNVNLAARLEANAGADEILISESTYETVKDMIISEKLEPLTVKGKAKPVTAYKLVDLMNAYA